MDRNNKPPLRRGKTANFSFGISFPFIFALFLSIPSLAIQQTNSTVPECQKRGIDVIVLMDISLGDEDGGGTFREQQNRLEKTIRHIHSIGHKANASIHYGLVAFHRLAFMLTPFNLPNATSVDKILEQIQGLKPHNGLVESSPAKALDLAAEIIQSGENGEKTSPLTIVLMVHDGRRNTDLIAETLEASNKLAKMGIPIFAIGGGEGESGNEQTLLGYTKDRARIWGNGKPEGEEHGRFNEAIEKEIAKCPNSAVSAKKKVPAKGGGNNGELEMLKCAQNSNEVNSGKWNGEGEALPFADFLPTNV